MIDAITKERWASLIGKSRKFGQQIPWKEFQVALDEIQRLEAIMEEDPWPADPGFNVMGDNLHVGIPEPRPDLQSVVYGLAPDTVEPVMGEAGQTFVWSGESPAAAAVDQIQQHGGTVSGDYGEPRVISADNLTGQFRSDHGAALDTLAAELVANAAHEAQSQALEGPTKGKKRGDHASTYNSFAAQLRAQGKTQQEIVAEWRRLHPKEGK